MKKLEKGFTLIELMIVVAIIAILAAVAAPRFGAQIARSRDARAVSLVGTWRSALSLDYSENEVYATNFSALIDNVDDATVNGTFSDTGLATVITSAGGITMYTQGGTTSVGTTDAARFDITGTATGSAIVFHASNGANTRGEAWTDF